MTTAQGDPEVPTEAIDRWERGEQHLATAIGRLVEEDFDGPSLLPGWDRRDVLAHLARNADAVVNLLTWARTGVETPMYASPEARTAGIEEGAARPLREQIEDIKASHERFADAGAAMPAEAWTVALPAAGHPAAAVPWSRLREVEVHHVDLGARYTPADWSDAFALRLLREIAAGAAGGPAMILRPWGVEHPMPLGVTDDATPVIGGPTKSLAAWLAGRADGTDLTVSPDGELPAPAKWK
jgi:maleylpyruvate isomerase